MYPEYLPNPILLLVCVGAFMLVFSGHIADRIALGRVRMKRFKASSKEKELIAYILSEGLRKAELEGVTGIKITKKDRWRLYSRCSRMLELPDTLKPYPPKVGSLKSLIKWRLGNLYPKAKEKKPVVIKFPRKNVA